MAIRNLGGASADEIDTYGSNSQNLDRDLSEQKKVCSLRTKGGAKVNRRECVLAIVTIAIMVSVMLPTTGTIGAVAGEGVTTIEGSADAICGVTAGIRGYSRAPIVATGNISWVGKTNPDGNFYNFYHVSTPYGSGCHIDTAGSSGNNDNYCFFWLYY